MVRCATTHNHRRKVRVSVRLVYSIGEMLGLKAQSIVHKVREVRVLTFSARDWSVIQPVGRVHLYSRLSRVQDQLPA